MNIAPGAQYETTIETGVSGLTGQIEMMVQDNVGGTSTPSSPAGISERPAGSGVYVAVRIAPQTAGQYTIVWSTNGTYAPETVSTDEILITHSAYTPTLPSGHDLCTLADVARYVPGYVPTENTVTQLAALITSESEAIADETGREIRPADAQPATRLFPIGVDFPRTRRIQVGDMDSVPTAVELLDVDGVTVAATIDQVAYRCLYRNKLQPTMPWEPITAIEFPAGRAQTPTFTAGQTLRVTGTWGFPGIPQFIVEACAKRVILRYASDVAGAGTQLASAIAEINLAAMFASARDDVERLKAAHKTGSVRLS